MSTISALISAYHGAEWLDARIGNLFDASDHVVDPIVVCQINSEEDKIASQYNIKIIRTFDIPTIGKAWNMAIAESTGEYLTTANTDDKFYSGGLTRMVDLLDVMDKIGLVFSQVDLDNGRSKIAWKRIGNRTGEIINIYEMLKRRYFIGSMPVWRRSIHEKVGLFREDYKVASDYDMWVRMAKDNVRFFYFAESLGVYLKRPGSLEHRNPEACRLESKEMNREGGH